MGSDVKYNTPISTIERNYNEQINGKNTTKVFEKITFK